MDDRTVLELLEDMPGQVGFYYKDLTTGETFGYRAGETFQAASVIKLPILAAIYLRAEREPGLFEERLTVREEDKLPGCGALQHIAGEHSYDIASLCRLMTVISDNTATNVLIRRFGLEELNAGFARLGLERTRLYRLLFDAQAAARGLENLFVPEEIGALLERLCRGELVSPQADRAMIELLKAQQINHKIPGRLPPDIPVAHKTGEDTGIANDVGIVFARHPMVLAFASTHTDTHGFERAIRDISYYFVEERK